MDGLDKSLPLAEGMIAAEEQGASNHGDGRHCLNCGTVLSDAYCPHCGQKDIAKRQTLGELLSNFVSSFWSFESKFFKTGLLLLNPGFLAIEYTQGRRERYYHPARMYVFISFIYFLLITGLPDSNDTDGNSSENSSTISFNEIGDDFPLDSLHYDSHEAYDSAQNTLAPEARDGWLVRHLREREIMLSQKYKGNFAGFIEDFTESYIDNFPKIFFFLLPVFAILFKILYIRRDFYFSEHLVFSIYYYNFFFLAGSLAMLLDLIPWMDWFVTLLQFWIVLYLLFAMKRVYKQSWAKTIVKYCTFLMLFSVCVAIGLFVNLMATLLYI